jgi:hypothetical protein
VIIHASFDWNGESDLLKRCHLEKGGLVQKSIDKSVIEYDMKYCPTHTGKLAESAYVATVIGSGMVVYPGPYAHYMYYEEIYGPNIPVFEDNTGEPTTFFSPPGQKKERTGRPLQYSTDDCALAGGRWFERMVADHRDDIIREAKSVAGPK